MWAGSTSLGIFTIKLIKFSNPSIPVITTGSPHNHDLLRSLGADAVFDYRDPDAVGKIKNWVNEHGYENGIEKAVDAISSYGALNFSRLISTLCAITKGCAHRI